MMSNENKRPTQTERVIDYITKFGEITTFEAFSDLGILRLASRISEIKKRGIPIKRDFRNVKNRFGESVSIAVYGFDKAQ